MTAVESNGIPFDVVDGGVGAPPVVFIHGLACDAGSWAPQQEDLARDHRSIAINLRGRGSTPPEPPFDLDQQARDVAAVMDALGIANAIVVGHSLGGAVGLLLNESRPDLVSGLVVADSPLRADGLDGSRLAQAVREGGSTEAIKPLLEGFWTELTSDDVKELAGGTMISCEWEVLAGMIERSISAEHMLDLVQLADQKPFMAIWAERPAGDPAWLRDVTMFVRQEPIAGAGHFFQLEQPAVTNALIRAFLEEASRDPRTAT